MGEGGGTPSPAWAGGAGCSPLAPWGINPPLICTPACVAASVPPGVGPWGPETHPPGLHERSRRHNSASLWWTTIRFITHRTPRGSPTGHLGQPPAGARGERAGQGLPPSSAPAQPGSAKWTRSACELSPAPSCPARAADTPPAPRRRRPRTSWCPQTARKPAPPSPLSGTCARGESQEWWRREGRERPQPQTPPIPAVTLPAAPSVLSPYPPPSSAPAPTS